MSDGNIVTAERLARVARRIGSNNTTRLLSSLGRTSEFVKAMETDAGAEIIGRIYKRLESKIDEVVSGVYKAGSEKDIDCRAEIRVLKSIIEEFTGVIEKHAEHLKVWAANTQV